MLAFLYGMSQLFKAGIHLRNFLFDHLSLGKNRVDIPVISIGNIVAGGTGKTALIQRIAKDLASEGKLSILTRGYRSKAENSKRGVFVSLDSPDPLEVCGDEAALLAKHLPFATLFVGKNRVRSARRAASGIADFILLDDGMQYRSLVRDVEIVLLHGDDPYGQGYYLPRGYLRDSPKRLRVADYIIVNHIHDEQQFTAIKKELARITLAPVIATHMVARGINAGSGLLNEPLEGHQIAAFCGLGSPNSFYNTVESLGVTISEKWNLPDHTAPKEKDLTAFSKRAEAKGCKWIVCSEKDWVKLPRSVKENLPIAYLDADLTIREGEEEYAKLLSHMKQLIREGKAA